MWILPLVGYLGIAIGFGFLTLAIASGLYYLSELVEEHTVLAKRLLTRLIYGIVGLQLFLALVDGFPVLLSLLSIASHFVYAANLRKFPFVKLTDGVFISSCALVLLNHYLWFRHFSHPPSKTLLYGSSSSDLYPDMPSFSEIAAFFGICVWLVPFALFVSLSAGDNVLPTMSAGGGGGGGGGGDYSRSGDGNMGRGKREKKGLAKAAVDGVREWVSETGELMGFWRGERTRL
ncbi:MAG: erv26 super protein [Thelocarpon impressellum]|nr:MAG: erv26 super protein [Thelocarpon impressellum]